MTEQEWHATNLALKHQAEEAEIARYVEWREREERRLRTKFSAQKAAALKVAPPPPAMSGIGWKVIANPRLSSHEELETQARAIWKAVWHGIPWPANWRVRWGKLDALVLTIASALGGQCALRDGRTRSIILGLCVPASRIILLDEANNRDQPAQDRDRTVIHELVHANLPNEGHGPRFEETLKSATTFYFARGGLAPTGASVSGPPPWAGARFRPGVGLVHPGIEYRG